MKKLAKKIISMDIGLLYCITTVLYVCWVMFVVNIYDGSGISYSTKVYGKLVADEEVQDRLGFVFIPFIEEICFRWLPLFSTISLFSILKFALRKNNVGTQVVKTIEKIMIIAVALVSSLIFGFLHGGVYNILLQGVLGLILSMFYLRTYYRRKFAKEWCYLQIYPLLSSTLYHILTNGIWYCMDNVSFG